MAVPISVIFEEVVHTAIEGPGQDPGFTTMAVVAPVVEETAKGLFLVLMLTGRRRNELNTLTDCLVYAGFTAVGFPPGEHLHHRQRRVWARRWPRRWCGW